MIKRVNGKLELESLDLMIKLGDLFENCKTEREKLIGYCNNL